MEGPQVLTKRNMNFIADHRNKNTWTTEEANYPTIVYRVSTMGHQT